MSQLPSSPLQSSSESQSESATHSDSQIVKVIRIGVAAGGAITFTVMHYIDPIVGLIALVAIAIPSQASDIIKLIGRFLPGKEAKK